MSEKNELSIVVPAYNEASNLPVLVAQLADAVSAIVSRYEIIIVDDGSSDNTVRIVHQLQEHDQHIKLISLSRNFGHQAALHAGLDYSTGEAVITMDADLQHPPELIGQMIREYKNGYDLVLAERVFNNDNRKIKSIFSKLFYFILNKISNVEIRANVADFNLYGRKVLDVLKKMPEKDRFLRGLAQWIGFRKTYITYEANKRYSGESKYGFGKMIKLAITGITSFSALPLRLAWWFGLVVILSGFIYGGYIVVEYVYFPERLIAGWTSLITVVLIIGGAQLIILGIIGEYLFKMFYEVKGRPLYIISHMEGFDNSFQVDKLL